MRCEFHRHGGRLRRWAKRKSNRQIQEGAQLLRLRSREDLAALTEYHTRRDKEYLGVQRGCLDNRLDEILAITRHLQGGDIREQK